INIQAPVCPLTSADHFERLVDASGQTSVCSASRLVHAGRVLGSDMQFFLLLGVLQGITRNVDCHHYHEHNGEQAEQADVGSK
ncbi:MAG: hypothetical protein WC829_24255, partial [Hyphomicrobium sp.]